MNSKYIADLLVNIPYLIMEGPLPPIRVLNSILKRGAIDCGMSGSVIWDPIEITIEEYASVISALHDMKSGLIEMDPPDIVSTREEWMSWRVAQKFGGNKNPKLPELLDRRRSMNIELKKVEMSGNEEHVLELKMQLIEISAEISKIIRENRESSK